MARIRNIKPEFFTDEQIAELPAIDRLVYIGLWTIADKAGRLEDRPKRIKALLLPYESTDITKILTRLIDAKFLIQYEVSGKSYLQIRTWEKHQRVHHTEAESTIPPPNAPITVRQPLGNGEATDCIEGGIWKVEEGEGKADTPCESDDSPAPSITPVATPADFIAAWNASTTPPISRCTELNDKRKRAIAVRLRERPLSDWIQVFERIERSPFCRGDNDRGWRATFDWVLQPDVAAKVLEGKYDRMARPATSVRKFDVAAWAAKGAS